MFENVRALSLYFESIVGGFAERGTEGNLLQRRRRLGPTDINGDPEGKDNPSSRLSSS